MEKIKYFVNWKLSTCLRDFLFVLKLRGLKTAVSLKLY